MRAKPETHLVDVFTPLYFTSQRSIELSSCVNIVTIKSKFVISYISIVFYSLLVFVFMFIIVANIDFFSFFFFFSYIQIRFIDPNWNRIKRKFPKQPNWFCQIFCTQKHKIVVLSSSKKPSRLSLSIMNVNSCNFPRTRLPTTRTDITMKNMRICSTQCGWLLSPSWVWDMVTSSLIPTVAGALPLQQAWWWVRTTTCGISSSLRNP